MKEATWNRGDGLPAPERLDRALEQILLRFSPVEILLFGSGARGELRENSDIDLLIVLADGDPTDIRSTAFEIGEAIGLQAASGPGDCLRERSPPSQQ